MRTIKSAKSLLVYTPILHIWSMSLKLYRRISLCPSSGSRTLSEICLLYRFGPVRHSKYRDTKPSLPKRNLIGPGVQRSRERRHLPIAQTKTCNSKANCLPHSVYKRQKTTKWWQLDDVCFGRRPFETRTRSLASNGKPTSKSAIDKVMIRILGNLYYRTMTVIQKY